MIDEAIKANERLIRAFAINYAISIAKTSTALGMGSDPERSAFSKNPRRGRTKDGLQVKQQRKRKKFLNLGYLCYLLLEEALSLTERRSSYFSRRSVFISARRRRGSRVPEL